MPDFENSSNIAGADYDPASEKLTVRFRNGGQYAYAGVPQDVYAGLLSAPSAGSYFGSYIRNAYEAAKLEPESPAEGEA